jgi:tetratricopeptide (TPR) repeat protein
MTQSYYYRAAQLLFEKGGGERAIAAYKGVLATHPQDVDANLCLAALYRQQGQLNRAALAYETAAQALAARGRAHASLTVARMIIDMSPDNVARRMRLAEQYVRADLVPEAVRELEAAVAYLEGAGRSDEVARIAERLRALKGRQPSAAQAARKPSTDPRSQHRAPSAQEEDAASLIAEADSFLRLGLVDKATEHLSAALARNPFLRRLRDALIRLYVAQGKTKQAVAEIWALLGQCRDQQEELRYLRYLLRLDSQDQAARRQLDRILAESPASAERRTDTVPVLSMTRVESELRSALVGHRPPTDLAVTSVGETPPLEPTGEPATDEGGSTGTLSNVSTMRLSALGSDEPADPGAPLPTSATTRPDVDQVEAIAAEIAMSSRTFREELAEVEKCVRQGNYVDALHHLHVLAASYPHSNVVWAQLDEIERAQRKQSGAVEAQPPAAESSLTVSTEIGSALRSLKGPGSEPSQTTPTLGTLLPERGRTRTRRWRSIRPTSPRSGATRACRRRPPHIGRRPSTSRRSDTGRRRCCRDAGRPQQEPAPPSRTASSCARADSSKRRSSSSSGRCPIRR